MLRIIASTLAVAAVAAPLALQQSATTAGSPRDGAERASFTLAASTTPTRRVLVRAGFDKLPLGPMSSTEFNSQMKSRLSGSSVFDDSYVVRRGTVGKAYRVTLDKGSFKNYPSGNNGINAIIPLPKAVNNACIAYGIRFSKDFDWSLGGKLPGLGGVRPGVSPGTPTGGGNPGDKGWSGRLMWLGPKAYSWAGPTNMAVSYMYSPRQQSTYGDNVRWNRPFKAGKWHRVKQCYTLNTPGRANGRLVAYMDGKLVHRNTSYVFRTRDDVKINYLYWAVFRGGNDTSWAGHWTSHVDFDNLWISTRA